MPGLPLFLSTPRRLPLARAECLDGAQRFLKPDGISIPQAYTSYLHPISSHKLWNDVKVRRRAARAAQLRACQAGGRGAAPSWSRRLHADEVADGGRASLPVAGTARPKRGPPCSSALNRASAAASFTTAPPLPRPASPRRRRTTTWSTLRRPTSSSSSASRRSRRRRRAGARAAQRSSSAGLAPNAEAAPCSAGSGGCLWEHPPGSSQRAPSRLAPAPPHPAPPPRAQAVFTFEHPNHAAVIDNTRGIRLTFDCTPPGGMGALGALGSAGAAGSAGCWVVLLHSPCFTVPAPVARSPQQTPPRAAAAALRVQCATGWRGTLRRRCTGA